MKRCEQGHMYDASQHTSCPHCGIPDLQVGKTVPKRPTLPEPGGGPAQRGGGPDAGRGAGATVGRGGGRGDAAGRTVGVFQKRLGVNPVVGWLVCVEGPDRGRDYRIRSGRNFIGRDERMDIWIRGDDAVSREKHAIVSYDPKNGRFKLLPGESTGLTYLNEETVDVPVELKPFDTIELGESKLAFVPFCGKEFRWATESEGAGA